MKKNIGATDRTIRFLLGIAFISLFFLLDGGMKYISLIGVVLIITAFLKFCPLYPLLRVNTCAKKNSLKM
ncbi:DUF2892 domain-containing protein [Cytobacillus sp. Hz8]|uniref:YgaP family membrane protein n=1 Tax=Cytobacillus sp. Hz8 TaxID=3347168 RepID=UPI0035E224AF